MAGLVWKTSTMPGMDGMNMFRESGLIAAMATRITGDEYRVSVVSNCGWLMD